MVSITDKRLALTSKDNLDLDTWLDSIKSIRPKDEVEVIRRACDLASRAHVDQKRASGEPYFQHSLAVANILDNLRLDHESIAAAILHDVVEDTKVSLQEIRDQFGDSISRLVDGVTKMKLIQMYQNLSDDSKKERVQAENLRKMLLAMAEDIRVVLIKLADRTHNMRTLSYLPPSKQQDIARETFDIYAPLANRLGIWQIKWELEDLSFRYLEPALYKEIASMLDERRIDREEYIAQFIDTLNGELSKAGIDAEVSGRPKHLYSIWRKMERKNLGYNQIYDVRGVRILSNEISDCYAALGIVHSHWQYIPGEFDDYITTPKENNYQSIHTAVIGPEGKTVEVQIRTHEMHELNELGVAAHWRYKEGAVQDNKFDDKIVWLRQLLEWKDEIADASEFVNQLKSDVFEDRIYVFTPQGKVIDLAIGSTPLDFAYHIHTEVGHRCRGAKVNGNIVPLTYQLETGQQVEILTVKNATPSRDWLNLHLGYLKSSKARAKVQQWFKQQDHEKNLVDGRAMFEKEMRRLGLGGINLARLSERLGHKEPDDMFVAIARNETRSSQYVNAVQGMLEPAVDDTIEDELPKSRPRRSNKHVQGIQVQGVGNLLTNAAQCCKPVLGDEIAGYITRQRGITIHRSDCPNLLRYAKDRVISVDWGVDADVTFPVDIQITAFDRKGLLRDITSVLANDKINLIGVNTLSDKKDHQASMRLTVEVPNLDVLSRVLARIDQLPNIMEVRRFSEK